jgi:hypothetical protein
MYNLSINVLFAATSRNWGSGSAPPIGAIEVLALELTAMGTKYYYDDALN